MKKLIRKWLGIESLEDLILKPNFGIKLDDSLTNIWKLSLEEANIKNYNLLCELTKQVNELENKFNFLEDVIYKMIPTINNLCKHQGLDVPTWNKASMDRLSKIAQRHSEYLSNMYSCRYETDIDGLNSKNRKEGDQEMSEKGSK